MFNFLKHNSNQQDTAVSKLQMRIGGMHCSSCAVNIDLTLEDIPGVVESNTNYTKSLTQLTVKKEVVDIKKIEDVVKEMGYQVDEIEIINS